MDVGFNSSSIAPCAGESEVMAYRDRWLTNRASSGRLLDLDGQESAVNVRKK